MNSCPDLSEAVRCLDTYIDDPRSGLPEEVFLFASRVTPMVNVDLLIRDARGRILLAWRDDVFSGQGWHIPGGIVRFQESLATRIQETAIGEIGCEVAFDETPVEFVELIKPGKQERSHFITFVYDCRLPESWDTGTQLIKAGEVGFLAWHETFPENMIPVHHFYRKYFRQGS